MKFIDFSPSRTPSLDQQRDALQKGLGRAVVWAKAQCLSDDLLLNACLTDQRYDIQVEESRVGWLWQIMEILDAQRRFRVPILHAFYELLDQRSSYQLCELACCYAQTGDEAFRARLYEIVESRPFTDSPSLGEAELIRLDKAEAFSFIARVRGQELSLRDWDWHDERFLSMANEQLGEGEVRTRLANAVDEGTRRFRDRWDQAMPRTPLTPYQHEDRMRSLSASDILSEASKENPSLGWFRGWGMRAADSDLQLVLARLWDSTKPTEIGCLLRVFANRALPSFDRRLIDLCQHADADVRRWAFNALENNADPAVRKFALQRLQQADAQAIGLLVNNFEPGDEQAILDGIELPDDSFETHSALFDVIKLLENNDDADASQLGVVVYALTPCETCRLNAVRLLQQRRVAPDWLIAECRHDCVAECRTLCQGEETESE